MTDLEVNSNRTSIETSTPSSSISPVEKKELEKEDSNTIDIDTVSLAHFVGSASTLVDRSIDALGWQVAESIIPSFLKGKTKEEVKQVLVNEVEGMSHKRLLAILRGENLEGSSSSEEEDDVEDGEDENDVENTEVLNLEQDDDQEKEEASEDVAVEKIDDENVEEKEEKQEEINKEEESEEGDGEEEADGAVDSDLSLGMEEGEISDS